MLEKGRLQLERTIAMLTLMLTMLTTIAMLTIKHWISSKPTQNFSIPPFKGYYRQGSDQKGLYFIISTIRLPFRSCRVQCKKW